MLASSLTVTVAGAIFLANLTSWVPFNPAESKMLEGLALATKESCLTSTVKSFNCVLNAGEPLRASDQLMTLSCILNWPKLNFSDGLSLFSMGLFASREAVDEYADVLSALPFRLPSAVNVSRLREFERLLF